LRTGLSLLIFICENLLLKFTFLVKGNFHWEQVFYRSLCYKKWKITGTVCTLV
jgi:hypothetical protein